MKKWIVNFSSAPALRVLALLALALAGLLLALLVPLSMGYPAWQVPAALNPDASALAVHRVPPLAIGADAGVRLLARPLFAPDRRPPAAPAAEAAPTEPDAATAADGLATFKLIGVIGSGAGSVALVDGPHGERRLHLGGQLEGWSLSQLDAEGATFTRPLGADEAKAAGAEVHERHLPFVRLPRQTVGQPPRPLR